MGQGVDLNKPGSPNVVHFVDKKRTVCCFVHLVMLSNIVGKTANHITGLSIK